MIIITCKSWWYW